MTNEAFLLLTESQRSAKFRAVLNTKTKGGLTGEQIQKILYNLPANRQYEVVMYHESDDFQEGINQTKGARKRLVLGDPCVETRTEAGKLVCDTQSVTIAVIVQKKTESEELNQLHIFVPLEQKGDKSL